MKEKKLIFLIAFSTLSSMTLLVAFVLISKQTIPDHQSGFIEEVKDRGGFALRDIYEQYYDDIGPGQMIADLQDQYPKCHDRGHDLGKVIFSKEAEIGPALQTCGQACFSGCMHGVMMEAFDLGENADKVVLEAASIRLCEDQDYKRGDCIHGVGHALMNLSDYHIPQALGNCRLFQGKAEQYYCATGAYMEYISNHQDDPGSSLSPCGEFDHPAACFRYKMSPWISQQRAKGRSPAMMATDCRNLEGLNRLGCFHGLGNGYSQQISIGSIDFDELCSFGTDDDQRVCIEGVIERMAKYVPERAEASCQRLKGWKFDVCEQGRHNGMYSLTKDFSLYLP